MTTCHADTLNKRRAQRGASMPLALLLFLVCTVLASIVIAAATATAGQATTLKESEQSYYAVTSAAKLFRSKLDGGSIRLEQTATHTDTVKTEYVNPTVGSGGGSTTSRVVGSPSGYTLKINDSDLLPKAGSAPTFYELAVLSGLGINPNLSAGGSISLNSVAETAWNAPFWGGNASGLALHDLVVDSGDVDSKAIAVEVEREVQSDGSIALTFAKKQDGSGGDGGNASYSLKMTLTADVNTSVSSIEEISNSTVSPYASGYTREDTVKVTDQRDTTITWWASELSSTDETSG